MANRGSKHGQNSIRGPVRQVNTSFGEEWPFGVIASACWVTNGPLVFYKLHIHLQGASVRNVDPIRQVNTSLGGKWPFGDNASACWVTNGPLVPYKRAPTCRLPQ